MAVRRSYPESVAYLHELGLLDQPDPVLPQRMPRYDDDEPLGVQFFRTMLADVSLENVELPRTFISRSEMVRVSFRNTLLSESSIRWNDFIDVDFFGADLSACDMRASVFTRVNFGSANLSGADMRHCAFDQCRFTDANLRLAKLTRAAESKLELSPQQRLAIDWQTDDGPEPEGG